MDDEQFKTEMLSRLDRIVQLLSISCSISKAALERSQQEGAKQDAAKQLPTSADRGGPSRHYLDRG